MLHNGNFVGATASDSWRPVTAAFLAQDGLAAKAPRASQQSPFLVQGRRRFVAAWEDQRKHGRGWGIFGASFGLPATDQASSYSGATRLRQEQYEVLGVYKYT